MRLPKIKKDNVSITTGQDSVSPIKNRLNGQQNQINGNVQSFINQSEANTTITTRLKSAHSQFQGSNEDIPQLHQIIGSSQNKLLSSGKKSQLKQHPLSAVQRSNKLSNNLYSIVNNKLVRNVPNGNSNGDLTDGEASLNNEKIQNLKLLPQYTQDLNKNVFQDSSFISNKEIIEPQTEKKSRLKKTIEQQTKLKKPQRRLHKLQYNNENQYNNSNLSPAESDNEQQNQTKQQKNKTPQNHNSNPYSFLSKAQNSMIKGNQNTYRGIDQEASDNLIEITKISQNSKLNPYINKIISTAWNEESIREENEFAENDELVNGQRNNTAGNANQQNSQGKSSKMSTIQDNGQQVAPITKQSNPLGQQQKHNNMIQINDSQAPSLLDKIQAIKDKRQKISEIEQRYLHKERNINKSDLQNPTQALSNFHMQKPNLKNIRNKKYSDAEKNILNNLNDNKNSQINSNQNIINPQIYSIVEIAKGQAKSQVEKFKLQNKNARLRKLTKGDSDMSLNAKINKKLLPPSQNGEQNLKASAHNSQNNDSFYFDYNQLDPRFTTSVFNDNTMRSQENTKGRISKIGNNNMNVKVSDFEDDINYIEEKIVEATESDAHNTRTNFNKHNFFDDDEEEDKDDDQDYNLYYSDIGGLMSTLNQNQNLNTFSRVPQMEDKLNTLSIERRPFSPPFSQFQQLQIKRIEVNQQNDTSNEALNDII
ncbi:UNKNOWN [Stylonychia lemnae]|uniref:Uncharacterized protein n=1 Tax=Stylonychia lemnae TaxID=5949 RepID=A0A078A9C3_STYLE|nr:UNKNOWN [Stylonychia lemnae]|eukprot:CDW78197.1 UNKNOWN [Stylonychia lemnae]